MVMGINWTESTYTEDNPVHNASHVMLKWKIQRSLSRLLSVNPQTYVRA